MDLGNGSEVVYVPRYRINGWVLWPSTVCGEDGWIWGGGQRFVVKKMGGLGGGSGAVDKVVVWIWLVVVDRCGVVEVFQFLFVFSIFFIESGDDIGGGFMWIWLQEEKKSGFGLKKSRYLGGGNKS
ncbi:hypothetical protein LWI29_003795 [Acer saccharum]|uniref:Uncharacterized protein n=1 Tax=Acer saccharum TaxID=4024 RepID=A0AA39SM17_ACESA|nr:hypothetical protein LWI29_003795 [Acer saccharum]